MLLVPASVIRRRRFVQALDGGSTLPKPQRASWNWNLCEQVERSSLSNASALILLPLSNDAVFFSSALLPHSPGLQRLQVLIQKYLCETQFLTLFLN